MTPWNEHFENQMHRFHEKSNKKNNKEVCVYKESNKRLFVEKVVFKS